MKLTLIIATLLNFMYLIQAQQTNIKQNDFRPAQIWLDNSKVAINAHGGGLLFHKNKYYWYGEHKIKGKSEEQFADGGIHCYSSIDLINWRDEGLVLSVDYKNPKSDIAYGCILERPKVVFNKKNKQFVVYFKLYLAGVGYITSNIGVAVADKPTGPFKFHHKFFGADSPNGSGDFSMFKDDDGSLYHLTVRKPDKAFVIGKLDSNYYYPVGPYKVCKGIEAHTEAPAVIKREGLYHMLGSGSTGWKPNTARYYTTKSILGEWTNERNPCAGYNPVDSLGVDKNFGSQSSFIFPVNGIKEGYIAMFDIWRPENPTTARYIWLPIDFVDNKMSITWYDKWNLKVFTKNTGKKNVKVPKKD